MTKKFFSKIMILAIFASVAGFSIYQFVQADDVTTGTTVGNLSPVPYYTTSPASAVPGDGGSHNGTGPGSTDGNPTNEGDDVTFSAYAVDENADDYYLAICKTDVVNANNGSAPTCDTSQAWVVSSSGQTNNTQEQLLLDTTGLSSESYAWYAYVCDADATLAACYPTTGGGDQGNALGRIDFTDVPGDGETVRIESASYDYEFDTGGACSGAEDYCVDCTSCADGADAAAALRASIVANHGANVVSALRGSFVYVYATTAGTAGNSYVLTETCAANCAIGNGETTFVGGDAENSSPFYVNHAPTFGAPTFTDTGDSSTIEPNDTLRITIAQADLADGDTGDTINMYVCSGESDMGGATTAFDYSANTCTGGTLICSDTAVNPSTTDATCDDTTSLLTAPVADTTYNVVIYVEDNHDMPGTGTNTRSYTVSNVVPTLNTSYGGGDGYNGHNTDDINDADKPTAGLSAAVSWTAGITDLNGDNDVTGATGSLFDDSAVAWNCSADENDCYVDSSCNLSDQSVGGSGHEADGTDTSATVTCDFTVWYNAKATADGATWTAHVRPSDTVGGEQTGLADSGADQYTVNAVEALDLTTATIAYGTVEIGGTSSPASSSDITTTVQNKGNQVLDFYIDGDNMISGGNNIPYYQQKWHYSSYTFDWDTAEPTSGPNAQGPWTLEDTASGTNEGGGCANNDIAVMGVHDSGDTDESIYWRIRIPLGQASGTYSGTNTFTAAASTTCSTAYGP